MKTIVRALIILEFGAIIFVPGIYLSRPMLILMFASMAVLVVLYWFAMFWVSKKDAEKVPITIYGLPKANPFPTE